MNKSIIYWSDKFRSRVDKEIIKFIPRLRYPPNLYPAIWYHLDSGGKRLRSTCAILMCKAFSGDVNQVMPFAASCEVLHNWLLIHDDIEDGDEYRRDHPAVWCKFGISNGINIGDFLSEKMYEILLSTRNKGVNSKILIDLLKAVVDTTLKTGEGQALDLHFRNIVPKEPDYIKMTKLKTGAYLALPLIGGAMIAGADKRDIKLIKDYGNFIGPAFQIMDDIFDYDKSSKNFGSDVKEGKRTLMIIHCTSNCNQREKKIILNILNKPREKTSLQDIHHVKNLLKKYGSIDYSLDRAKFFVIKGKQSIKKLDNAAARDLLCLIADFIVNRTS